MYFAILYYKDCRVLPYADEIIIQYKEKTVNLIDFVQKYNESQRIVIDITQLKDIEENLDIFKAAWKVHPQFAVLLSREQNYVDIAEMGIPFFFIEGASCMDDLLGIVHLGVSDVYIVNELGFDLERVSSYCHSLNIKVRVYPNVAQSSTKFNINNLTKFFIRPDAMKLYSKFIDVIEFFGPLDKQPVLFDIYTDERWLGNLSEIIIGLKEPIDNQTLVPYFDAVRTNCRKICAIEKCNTCNAARDFGKALETKDVGIRRRKADHGRVERFNDGNMRVDPGAVEKSTDSISEKSLS
jgi:hypothetical protein